MSQASDVKVDREDVQGKVIGYKVVSVWSFDGALNELERLVRIKLAAGWTPQGACCLMMCGNRLLATQTMILRSSSIDS